MSTATTITRIYRPLTDPSDLTGTILDPSNADKDLTISLPFAIFEDVSVLRLPARLRQVKMSSDGMPLISDIQRAADRAVQAVSDYIESKSEESVLRLKETVSVYIRNVHRQLAWRFEDLVNPRDSFNTSSAYLVGIPGIRHQAFADGNLCDLKPWQVAIHPSVAAKLSITVGQKIQLCRFPETRTMVVEAVIDPTTGKHCLGLPIGEPNLAAMLGGDCDGDCYCIRAYHTRECQTELGLVFAEQWADCPESSLPDTVLSWRDETPSVKSDEEIAASKYQQKTTIGPVTLDAMSAFIVKMAAKARLSLSYAQIRGMMERSLETAMDMKKVEGHDPLLFRRIITGERVLDLEARAELAEQGYIVEDVQSLVEFISRHGGSIRKLARTNPAWDILLGTPDAVERFLETAPEDLSGHFLDSIFGKSLRKPGDRRFRQKLSRSKQRFGHVGFVATMDRKSGEITIECGLGECRVRTSEGGKAIRLSSVEVSLLRPTVEVSFLLKGGRLSTSTTIHHGWASLINAIARSEYAWEIWEIVGQPDADVAKADLERLVKKILRRMFKSYQVDGGCIDSWDAVCNSHRYVVLDTPLPRVDGYDFMSLEMMRREAAAEALVKRGLINHRSDTTCGDPGMSFYGKFSASVTYVTASDPLSGLASLKRSSVRNALGNLIDIGGAQPESFVTDAERVPPMAELNVAVLPVNSMDAVIVSDAVSEKLTAKIPVVLPGCDFSGYSFHPLEDGSKLQARLDMKGVARVIPHDQMPWIKYSDGTRVRADVVMPLDSRSHEMLRHSHCTLALTAAANRLKETTDGRMRVPKDVSVERIAKVVQRSGLYDSDEMTCEILKPNGELIGRYPAGMAAVGVHRQIPSVIASVHGRESAPEHYPTSIADGGVVSGLAGVLCMKAEGLDACSEELHGDIHPELEADINALRRCIVRG